MDIVTYPSPYLCESHPAEKVADIQVLQVHADNTLIVSMSCTHMLSNCFWRYLESYSCQMPSGKSGDFATVMLMTFDLARLVLSHSSTTVKFCYNKVIFTKWFRQTQPFVIGNNVPIHELNALSQEVLVTTKYQEWNHEQKRIISGAIPSLQVLISFLY